MAGDSTEHPTRWPLYRSSTDRVVVGVCGGLAQFWHIDSTIIRLVFVVLLFWGGLGFWLYLILAIVIPSQYRAEQSSHQATHGDAKQAEDSAGEFAGSVHHLRRGEARIWFGLMIILLGIFLLLGNLNLLPFDFWNQLGKFWPALLVIFGLGLLIRP